MASRLAASASAGPLEPRGVFACDAQHVFTACDLHEFGRPVARSHQRVVPLDASDPGLAARLLARVRAIAPSRSRNSSASSASPRSRNPQMPRRPMRHRARRLRARSARAREHRAWSAPFRARRPERPQRLTAHNSHWDCVTTRSGASSSSKSGVNARIPRRLPGAPPSRARQPRGSRHSGRTWARCRGGAP